MNFLTFSQTEWILLALIAVFLLTSIGLFINILGQKKTPIEDEVMTKSLEKKDLDQNIFEAIRDLSQIYKKNKDFPELYLILGNLYRIKGEAGRSLAIHQNLLAQSSSNKIWKDKLSLEVGKDLIAIGAEDKALTTLNEISDRSPFFVPAQENIVKIHYGHQNFENAFEAMNCILKKKHSWRNRKRTAYMLPLASKQAVDSSHLRLGRQHSKKALTIDDTCILAHLVLGEIDEKEDKWESAIESYARAVRISPNHAPLALIRIEEAFYRMKSFVRYGKLLHSFANEFPDEPFLQTMWARHLRKKGQFNDARSILESVLNHDPQFLPAQEELMSLNQSQEQFQAISSIFQQAIDDSKAHSHWQCSNCATNFDELSWICEHCGQLETLTNMYPYGSRITPSSEIDLVSRKNA